MNDSDTEEVIRGDQSTPFLGVRFVLCGFDPIRKEQVLSTLLNGGGVDVRRYCPDCTHVIVDKVVYDDPICVSARRDGKVTVTSLWVDHCCEVGMPVDHTSILYRPLRDLNGIPGAKPLTICLTGYTGESRDDIMIMVGLMGATFSRSLITATATHLVCYKFEGEKYRTAKKVSNIKIVNHKWLEDCLKSWALLPETDYNKSGYDLEMMEAEVKDSEEEREDIPAQSNRERKIVTSPHNSRNANQSLLKLDSLNVTNSKISRSPQDAKILLQSFKKQDLSEDLNLCASRALSDQNFYKASSSAGKGPKPAQAETAACSDKLPDLPLNDNVLAYGAPTCTEQTSGVLKKSYSRKSRMKNSLVMEEDKGNGGTPFSVNAGRSEKGQNLISLLDLECDGLHTAGADSHTKVASPFGNEQSYISSEKRMLTTPSSGSKKQRKTSTHETRRDGALIPGGAEVLEAVSDAKNGLEPTNRSPVKIFNIPTPDGARELGSKEALETGLPETMEVVSADVEVQQKELQGIKVISPGSRAETKNLNELAGVQLLEGNTKSQPRKLKKRCLSTKTEKSKQTLGKGHASNQKGSIYLNKNGESAVCSTGGEEIKGKDDLNSEKADVASMHNGDSIKESGKNKSLESEAKETRHLFDATEAPDDTEDALNDGVPCDKAFDFESPHSVEKEEGNMLNTDFRPAENCDLETMVDKPDLNSDATYVKKQPKGKKCSLSKDKEVISRATKVAQSKEGAQKKRITTKKSTKGKGKQVNNSMEAEKENISDVNCEMQESREKSCKSNDIEDKGEVNQGLSVSNKDHKVGKVTPETCEKPNKGVETTENRYFIVSGHKLQKKEYQQVIKRLKGRSCRDSHNWSYHATHFILPDPVRRTEKFFAAAASGRWILKVDYLTACNEAGMFLPEEPYEWHKKGLSEDLAISLEAPRTWRLLRQRTGHGAFYGMRIVTYGEINRPSLDTLKRVVKAGDGTILATCPSYARFLKSDIDFAIVCPGTPRQDMWVQEFLSLKIPCVSVDYLVEYICKPGYSLDKHVLYNTHAWAEESLQKLMKRLKGEVEVDDMAAPPGDCDDGGGHDIRPSKSTKRKRLSST